MYPESHALRLKIDDIHGRKGTWVSNFACSAHGNAMQVPIPTNKS